MHISVEADNFQRRKYSESRDAKGVAAFYLSTGVDLADALAAPAVRQHHVILRLERILERERLRGQRRHWSYDLNRHIALKNALDLLRQAHEKKKAAPIGTASPLRDVTLGR